MATPRIELPFLLRILRRVEFPRKLGLLDRLFARTLYSHGVCWATCWNGVSWKLNLADPSHRWIVYGNYEGGVGIDCASRSLKYGGVFVDSGANIGEWSLYLSGIKGVRTLAFEPVDSQRNWLEECVSAQSGWNVQIYPYGLGAKSESVDIQCDDPRSTLRMDWYKAKNLKTQKIRIKRLSEFLNKAEVGKVAFWKLDVEGGELGALIGADKFLENQLIENIFFECHPSNYREVCRLLRAYGYGVFDLTRSGLTIKKHETISTTENLFARPIW